jgi:hypothetical protein
MDGLTNIVDASFPVVDLNYYQNVSAASLPIVFNDDMTINDPTLYGNGSGEALDYVEGLTIGLPRFANPSLLNGAEFPAADYPVMNNDHTLSPHAPYSQGQFMCTQADQTPFLPNVNGGPIANVGLGAPVQTVAPTAERHASAAIFPCTHPGCNRTFKRRSDCIRHNTTVHGANQGLHLCPIAGCVKSQGAGYCRPDKVTEHLWKKHADLGYTKGGL